MLMNYMKAPYPSSQAVLYHMSDTGLLFHIHGVQLPHVRCHVPDSKRICHEALPLMRMLQPRFQSQNIPAAQPDSWSAGILHSRECRISAVTGRSVLSVRIRSCSAALTLIYCCATSAFHAWRLASGNV